MVELSPLTVEQLFVEIGSLAHWLQAIGAVVLLWIIFQIANWIINRRRLKQLGAIADRLDKMDKKLSALKK